jgi:hypothetical protein
MVSIHSVEGPACTFTDWRPDPWEGLKIVSGEFSARLDASQRTFLYETLRFLLPSGS